MKAETAPCIRLSRVVPLSDSVNVACMRRCETSGSRNLIINRKNSDSLDGRTENLLFWLKKMAAFLLFKPGSKPLLSSKNGNFTKKFRQCVFLLSMWIKTSKKAILQFPWTKKNIPTFLDSLQFNVKGVHFIRQIFSLNLKALSLFRRVVKKSV